jgi:hypothetical protein
MRSGSLEAVFSYLTSSAIAPTLAQHESANISAYGAYLATRIKAYANLKRDVIRDKSDRRATNRLRKLTVEQGLLRETREIQRMIAALVETKFFNDDVDDDVSMSALRLLVKDCLVLFQAVNEAVINILGSSPFHTSLLLVLTTRFYRELLLARQVGRSNRTEDLQDLLPGYGASRRLPRNGEEALQRPQRSYPQHQACAYLLPLLMSIRN